MKGIGECYDHFNDENFPAIFNSSSSVVMEAGHY